MTISFKQFLAEDKVKGSPKPIIDPIEVSKAIKFLNANCKDALWMLEKNCPIWRGWRGGNSKQFMLADPTKSERRSGDYNHYMLLMDNLPAFKDWPKRSRSFIAATDIGNAESYGPSSAVIPVDGVKIGVCKYSDMWDTDVKFFGKIISVQAVGSYLQKVGVKDNDWTSFNRSLDRLTEEDLEELAFQLDIEDKTITVKQIKAELIKAFDPKRMGLALHTTKTLKPSKDDNEVWVGGPCVFIPKKMWESMHAIYSKLTLTKEEKEAYEYYLQYMKMIGEYDDDTNVPSFRRFYKEEFSKFNDFVKKYGVKDPLKYLKWISRSFYYHLDDATNKNIYNEYLESLK